MKLTKRKLRKIIKEEIQRLTERVTQSFEVGDEVELSRDAIKNYGSKHKGKTFRITNVATSDREHPGFDNSLDQALYDLEGFPNSVYDYELVGA